VSRLQKETYFCNADNTYLENIAPLIYTYTSVIDIVYMCARIWTLSFGGNMVTIKDTAVNRI